MKGHRGTISDSLYRFNWLIYADCPLQHAINHYCKLYKLEVWTHNSPNSIGHFFGHTSIHSYGLWFRGKRPPPEIIVHETLHAVISLAEHLKTPIEEKTEEMFTYYQQMLFRETSKLLRCP